jgi:CBS domain-containing protein
VQARELATPYPTVRLDSPARDAAMLLAERSLPGLIVVDDKQHPVAVLPGSQLLRFIIPAYVQDDPTLARVLDEQHADHLCDALDGKSVKELLPKERAELPVVAPDDTVIEIAALMAAKRAPVVAVVEERRKDAPLLGAITVAQLLSRLLPEAVGDGH